MQRHWDVLQCASLGPNADLHPALEKISLASVGLGSCVRETSFKWSESCRTQQNHPQPTSPLRVL